MKQILMILIAGFLTIVGGAVEADNKITVKSMPPVVVKTFPTSWRNSCRLFHKRDSCYL